jgi:uncharacterized protein (UPF0332 family)
MFELRQVDDYQRIEPVSLEEAQDAIVTAERFFAAVQKHLRTERYLDKE